MVVSTNAFQGYTLGRGKVFFARFTDEDTATPGPFRYVGNTPEFNIGVEEEVLDHYSSDGGIREKDDFIELELNRTITMTCDSINIDNLALFFYGTASRRLTPSASAQSETFTGAVPGNVYQLGLTEQDRVGIRGVTVTGVTSGMAANQVTHVVNADYTVDDDRGMVAIVVGGGITAATDITVNYDVRQTVEDHIISGRSQITGAMRYIGNNPEGVNRDILLPSVRISPNGEYALKGDEWNVIPFTVEILKPTVGEAVYVDGIPA